MLAHVTKTHHVDNINGIKLDSLNIFDYCIAETLTREQFDDILAERKTVERRYCSNNIINSSTWGPPPMNYKPRTSLPSANPPPSTGSNAALKPSAEDDDRKYDWLMNYPTVVCAGDGIWVELRCFICGGNCVNNSEKRFALGVHGFVRHLTRAHNLSANRTIRLDWAFEKCRFREVPMAEIHSLTDDDGKYAGPPKIPFKQDARKSDAVVASVPQQPSPVVSEAAGSPSIVPQKRRISVRDTPKLPNAPPEESDEPLDDAEMEDPESEYDPDGSEEPVLKKGRPTTGQAPKPTNRTPKKSVPHT